MFGRVKQYREERGLTKENVAERLEIPVEEYCKKENREVGFSLKEMIQLSIILRKKVLEIFLDKNEECLISKTKAKPI